MSEVVPMLDDKVDVGGCVGTIAAISPTEVIVEGSYHYSDGASDGESDPWAFTYARDAFAKVVFVDGRWDASQAPYGVIW